MPERRQVALGQGGAGRLVGARRGAGVVDGVVVPRRQPHGGGIGDDGVGRGGQDLVHRAQHPQDVGDAVVAAVRLPVAAEQRVEGGGGGPAPAGVGGPAIAQLLFHAAIMAAVTCLVDECRWPWRGRRWCHLVSDTDLDELHALAARLDVPRRAFQGDHYDLDEERRRRAIELGAVPVTSRELLVRLRAAGLRLSPAARRSRRGDRPSRRRGWLSGRPATAGGSRPGRRRTTNSGPGPSVIWRIQHAVPGRVAAASVRSAGTSSYGWPAGLSSERQQHRRRVGDAGRPGHEGDQPGGAGAGERGDVVVRGAARPGRRRPSLSTPRAAKLSTRYQSR